MCLSSVEAVYDKPSDLIVDGWKEFGQKDTNLRSQQFNTVIQRDTWIQASEQRPLVVLGMIKASDGKLYRVGFHAYVDEPKKGSFRRVYLRKITCTGDQDGKCVVAQEMYVPSDPNGWPPRPTPSTPVSKKKLMERVKKIVPYKGGKP